MLPVPTPSRPAPPAISPLRFLWLEITGQCNLTCHHCYAGSSPLGNHGVMQTHHWEQVLTDAVSLGCRSVQFIGGEPTLHPALKQLIIHANNLEMTIEVYTNLVTVKQDLWDTFEKCNVRLATSFYSCNAAVHAQITQNAASYDKTVRNIQQALKRKLPLRVGLVDMRDDQAIEETTTFLKHLGVQRLRIDKVRGVGRGETFMQVRQPEQALCGNCAHARAVVLPNGDVFPCPFSRWLKAGNVFQDSLVDVIGSDSMSHIRQRLQTHFDARNPKIGRRHQPLMKVRLCDPDDEECNPEVPICNPNGLCFPDLRPCPPEQFPPCDPDKESCSPEWDKDDE